jgi:hypothetical protein
MDCTHRYNYKKQRERSEIHDRAQHIGARLQSGKH